MCRRRRLCRKAHDAVDLYGTGYGYRRENHLRSFTPENASKLQSGGLLIQGAEAVAQNLLGPNESLVAVFEAVRQADRVAPLCHVSRPVS